MKLLENANIYNKNLLEIKFPNTYTKELNYMVQIFLGCWKIKKIELDYFKTEKVTNMEYLFTACKNLEKLVYYGFTGNNPPSQV